MKLTAQEEYGLRCILSLARKEAESGADPEHSSQDKDAKSLTINDIADLEGISPQYAGKLIRILGKAGLVASVRGCKGGYRLARPLQEVSVAEVLEALGSKIYDRKLCDRFSGERLFCVHNNDCAVRSLWTGIQLMIDRILTRTTLRELVTSERTMFQWMEEHLEDAQLLPSVESLPVLSGRQSENDSDTQLGPSNK